MTNETRLREADHDQHQKARKAIRSPLRIVRLHISALGGFGFSPTGRQGISHVGKTIAILTDVLCRPAFTLGE